MRNFVNFGIYSPTKVQRSQLKKKRNDADDEDEPLIKKVIVLLETYHLLLNRTVVDERFNKR